MSASAVLGVIAGLVHFSAYALYLRQVLRGASKPNAATWTLWTFLAVLNSASYLAMCRDPAKAATPIAGALACAVILTVSVWKGRLTRLAVFDRGILAIGLSAAAVWWVSRSATWANLLLQGAFVLSNVPTYRGVWRDPSTERPLPWFGFGLAYAINILVVLMRWQDQPADLAYPVLSLLTDAGVGAAVVLRRRMLRPFADA